jgi:hypothetical protein
VSASRLFGATLSVLLLAVAKTHHSCHAERAANAVPPAELAPRFDGVALPEKTKDGRTIPRERWLQVRNVLEKLDERGELPPHPDLSFATITLVAEAIADLDNGVGCWMSLRKLEKKTHRDERTIREVCEYLRDRVGMMMTFGRVKVDDRKLAGSDEPLTEQRTTVRVVFTIPRALAQRLSDEEILDLIAAGKKKPEPKLDAPRVPAEAAPGAASDAPQERAADPAGAAPRERATEPTRDGREAPAVTSAQRPAPGPGARFDAASGAALEPVIARIAALVDTHLDPAWIIQEAAKFDLELDHARDAMNELAGHIEKAQAEARANGRSFPALRPERVRERATKYLEGKRKWLDRGGEQAKLAAESRQREADYRAACKTPEQNERESGAARHARPPEAPPLHTSRTAKLRMLLACEEDPLKKAELERQLATERASGVAPHALLKAPEPTRMALLSFPLPPNDVVEPLPPPVSAPTTTSSARACSPGRPNQPDP